MKHQELIAALELKRESYVFVIADFTDTVLIPLRKRLTEIDQEIAALKAIAAQRGGG